MRPVLGVHVYYNSLSTSGRIHGYLPHFSINGTNTYVSKAMKTNSTTRARHTHTHARTHTHKTHMHMHIHTHTHTTRPRHTHTRTQIYTHTHVKLISNSSKYWRKEEKNPNDGGDITRGFFSIGLNVVHHQKTFTLYFISTLPPYPS